MVGGDDQGRRAAVGGEGLELIPEGLQVLIDVVGGVQVEVVAAGVGVLVGVAEGDVEDAGCGAAEVLQGGLEGEGVVAAVLPEAGRLIHQAVEAGSLALSDVAGDRLPAGVDGEAAGARAEDVREDVPGAEGGDRPR